MIVTRSDAMNYITNELRKAENSLKSNIKKQNVSEAELNNIKKKIGCLRHIEIALRRDSVNEYVS